MRPKRTSPKKQDTHGLLAWLEKTQIQLPLRLVECTFDVIGDVVDVEIKQVFHQNCSEPANVQYAFPLPAGASVHSCEMHLKDRVIKAKVEDRETAKAIARQKAKEGHRVVHVETERDNLFTLWLGNLAPDEVVVIRLAYVQPLNRLADWTSFSIPFCPGVRYIPGEPLLRSNSGSGTVDDTDQVPDASRITPPRIDQLDPEAARLSTKGFIHYPYSHVEGISSPSHPVVVRDEGEYCTVNLAAKDVVPDRDFTLRWAEPVPQEQSAKGWVSSEGDEAYALVSLRVPQLADDKKLSVGDVYILVDQSSSMEGLKWEKAMQALREFVKKLDKSARVWVTLFNNDFQDFAERLMSPQELLDDGGFGNLEGMGTWGGTKMLPGLQHVLGKASELSGDGLAAILLITDGQVGNERAVVEALKPHPKIRLHTFGIDTAVNDALLQQLAKQQGGTCCLMSPNDDIAGAVARVADQLLPPVLVDLKAMDGWEPADKLPNVHPGENVTIAFKGKVGQHNLTVEAHDPSGATIMIEAALQSVSLAAGRLLWAKQRIAALQADGQKAEAIALAKTHNILCQGAAFLEWDEVEKVAHTGPVRIFRQPSFLQHHLSRESKFVQHRLFNHYNSALWPRALSAFDLGDSDVHHSEPFQTSKTARRLADPEWEKVIARLDGISCGDRPLVDGLELLLRAVLTASHGSDEAEVDQLIARFSQVPKGQRSERLLQAAVLPLLCELAERTNTEMVSLSVHAQLLGDRSDAGFLESFQKALPSCKRVLSNLARCSDGIKSVQKRLKESQTPVTQAITVDGKQATSPVSLQAFSDQLSALCSQAHVSLGQILEGGELFLRDPKLGGGLAPDMYKACEDLFKPLGEFRREVYAVEEIVGTNREGLYWAWLETAQRSGSPSKKGRDV